MARSYLFLQGPHGPFFKELGRSLVTRGHSVVRVNFNGGDWIDWNGQLAIDFNGSQKEWPSFCKNLLTEHHITDLVVYGDCRSLHQSAIGLARSRKVRVHAFEEGYIRPDWITLEEDGVNGHSPLPVSPEWYRKNARVGQKRESEHVGPSLRWLIFYCLRHYFAKTLRARFFRSYNRHRPYRVGQEFLLWLRKLILLPLVQWRSRKRYAYLCREKKRYYLVGLQLDSDSQLRVHSPYTSVADFVTTVMKSFKEHAPGDAVLVFKKHPLDIDAVSYESLSMLLAYSLGIRDRVVFLHTGHLPSLIKGSAGVVVVNSTVGTSAVFHGRPTIALGEAVYNIKGLTWDGGLDRFWREGEVPDKALNQAFRTCLFNRILINGGFYNRCGRMLALAGAFEKLTTLPSAPLKKAPSVKPKKASVRPAAYGFNQYIQ